MSRNFFFVARKKKIENRTVLHGPFMKTFKITCPVIDPCFTQCKAVSELQSNRWSGF